MTNNKSYHIFLFRQKIKRARSFLPFFLCGSRAEGKNEYFGGTPLSKKLADRIVKEVAMGILDFS